MTRVVSRLMIRSSLILIISVVVTTQAGFTFTSGRADFQVSFKEEITPFRVTGVFALPGEAILIEAIDEAVDENHTPYYLLRPGSGRAVKKNGNLWMWTAPQESGHYPVHIVNPARSDSITLNVFVIVPYDSIEGEYLRGYRIGKYPTSTTLSGVQYDPPRGFVEVREEYRDVLVAPHFHLGQFLCKQVHECTPYVVLSERLLLKLEMTLERVNEAGHKAHTFHIMSGYRTPYYNRMIGNARYSRHVWGDAADIFVDQNPVDGMMDDLNRDGTIDIRDAGVLYDIIDGLCAEPWFESYVGGLGKYPSNTVHGPFVHTDVRGCRARW